MAEIYQRKELLNLKVTLDNLILVKGGAFTHLKKVLNQWIALYENNLEEGWTFKLYNLSRGRRAIETDPRLDTMRFFFLVNYLKYPNDIDVNWEVEGFLKGKEEKLFKGQDIRVFIAPNDTEYDNVFVTTSEGNVYKVDFGGKIIDTQKKEIFRTPTNLVLENPDIITVNKKELNLLDDDKSISGVRVRFVVLSTLVVLTFFASIIFYAVYQNEKVFNQITFFLGIGFFVWLFRDIKMLRYAAYYFAFLVLAFLLVLYQLYLYNQGRIAAEFLLSPFLFLISLEPLRRLFIRLVGREPPSDNSSVSNFADFIFITILVFISIGLPIFIKIN